MFFTSIQPAFKMSSDAKKPNMFKKTNRLDTFKKEQPTGSNRFNRTGGKSAFSRRVDTVATPDKSQDHQIKPNTESKVNAFSGRKHTNLEKKPKEPPGFAFKDGDFPSLGSSTLPKPKPALNYSKNIKATLAINNANPIPVNTDTQDKNEDVRNRDSKQDFIILPRIKKPKDTNDDHSKPPPNQAWEPVDAHITQYDTTDEDEYGNYCMAYFEDQPEIEYIYGWEVDDYLEEKKWEARWEIMDDGQHGNSDDDEDESVASDLEYM